MAKHVNKSIISNNVPDNCLDWQLVQRSGDVICEISLMTPGKSAVREHPTSVLRSSMRTRVYVQVSFMLYIN